MLHGTIGPLAHSSTFRRDAGGAALGLLLLGASFFRTSPAHAEQPSTQQCLEASDASIDLETRGELLGTREALRICASLSCPQQVRDECTRRLELVQQNIPSVRCEAVDETGKLLQTARVAVDGASSSATAGEFIELEPGRHTLTARAPGMLPVTQSVDLRARDKDRRVRFVLGPSTPTRGSVASLPPRRTAALITGGLGTASLATAAVFAVIALDRKHEAQSLCPSATCASPAGAERWQSAWRAGNFSTGFALGGALALAVAAGLWFSVDRSTTEVSVGPGQLQLHARF